MKTIKLPVQNKININEIQKVYNSCFRFAFNRFQDGLSEKDVRAKCRPLFQLNSWILQCAILDAKSNYNSWLTKKSKINPYFGSNILKKKFLKKEISKDEFKQSRLRKIMLQGEKLFNGNRMFKLDIIENNQIIFKEKCGVKQIIQLPKLRKNLQKELNQLQILTENKEITYSIGLTSESIEIVYEEIVKSKKKRNPKRILGIDLNPNYIGYSILEFDDKDEFTLIDKAVFDLTELNKKSENKIDFELYQICKRLVNIADSYNCKKLAIEDLKIRTKGLNKGKKINRLCINKWKRNKIINNLKKRCQSLNIEIIEVNPCYSSTIGNILYGDSNTPDMIASSIEIGRRGFKKYIKGWKLFPNLLNAEVLQERWKLTVEQSLIKDWKEFHNLIKNLKLKYRVLLKEVKISSSFSLNNIKSHVKIYSF